MFNSKEEYNNKSAERIRPSPFGNDSSGSKCRSNFKILNPKSKNFEEDQKLQVNGFSAKNNLMNNFQNLQKNFSIFNINEMSPTMNNYYPHLLLSNMDENKEKLCETPIKFNHVNNDIDWYRGNQGRDNSLPGSPLFPRNLNFKSNKNLEISSGIKKIHYCYNSSNITKKNLGFGIENSIQHNNIINSVNNNFILEYSNNHLYNYNNNNNNNFQFYQPKKLFINPQNQYGSFNRLQQDKVIPERKIIMSSDDEEVSVGTKNTSNNKNNEIDNKSGFVNYSMKGNKLKDDSILNSDNSFHTDEIANKRESIRKKLKRSYNSKLNQPLKLNKKLKNIILTANKQSISQENLIKDKKTIFIGESKQLIPDIVQKSKCTCSKTQCVKKYCECFSNGKFCVDCECENCQNVPNNLEYLNEIRAKENLSFGKDKEDVLKKTSKIVCNCTKSGCRKKYCECFKAGKKCSEECRCIHCDNIDDFRISGNLKKNKKLYLSEKRNNSKFRHGNQTIVDGPSEYSSDDYSKPIVYRSFDTNSFKLYNINVLINGDIISISEKINDLNIDCMKKFKNSNIINPHPKFLNFITNNVNKKITKKRLVNKIKKRNLNNKENVKNTKNKLELGSDKRLKIPGSKKFLKDVVKIEEEINRNSIKNNEDNKNFIHLSGDDIQNISSRRSARLRLNKNNIDMINYKLDNHPDVEGLIWEHNQERKNRVKNKNEPNLVDQDKRIHSQFKKNAKDELGQSLDFYSSVLNKVYIDKVLFKKDSPLKNTSGTNSFNDIEKGNEGQNEILLSSNKKGSKSKLNMFESASKLNDSNINEQILKITETPKLCEKKRYRNTTSGKTRVINEDVYIKTNSTMNQTPILHNDKNNKKKLIEVDKRIVKNLQSKYY